MEKVKFESFAIVGLAVRTTNENGQSSKDISELWNRFFSEGIISKIPNKVSDDIYCVYTDYEGDFMKPYTTILGCKVKNLVSIPEGLTGKTVNASTCVPFVAKGKLMESAVVKEWMKIWNSGLNRAYTADFEIYGAKAQNPNDAEVDIYVAVK